MNTNPLCKIYKKIEDINIDDKGFFTSSMKVLCLEDIIILIQWDLSSVIKLPIFIDTHDPLSFYSLDLYNRKIFSAFLMEKKKDTNNNLFLIYKDLPYNIGWENHRKSNETPIHNFCSLLTILHFLNNNLNEMLYLSKNFRDKKLKKYSVRAKTSMKHLNLLIKVYIEFNNK